MVLGSRHVVIPNFDQFSRFQDEVMSLSVIADSASTFHQFLDAATFLIYEESNGLIQLDLF